MPSPFGGGEWTISKLLQKQQQQQENEALFRNSPEIVKGVNLVSCSSDRPIFQSLVADDIKNAGKAVWIDSGNNCSTYALRSAGTEDLMRRVEIARCFTPYQHFSIIEQLDQFVDESTEILVVPEVSLLYEDGQLNEYEAEELFQEMWEELRKLVEKKQLKLLVSVQGVFSYLVEGNADNRIKINETSQGAKYRSNGFETLVYRRGNYIQTTVPYWRHRLGVSESGQNQRYLQKSS